MLISSMVANILQSICISNPQVKSVQILVVNYTSVKLGTKREENQNR